MQEYYKILGISENATDEEVKTAYEYLKNKYSKERFYEGEIGNDAARNLTKVETAYAEIVEARKNVKDEKTGKTINFTDIEFNIKNGNIGEAQRLLDDITDRNAEWHYLQSVVFYKKNWINDSKKQLEIAMNMEPHNEKYSDAYTKLKQKIEFNEKQFHSGNMGANGTSPNGQKQMGETGINNCLSTCLMWCCMDALCSICCR